MLNFLPINRCILCGFLAKSPICEECNNYLPRITENSCDQCKRRLQTSRCKICASGKTQFDKLYCQFNYSWPLNKILQQIKYHGQTKYATGLGYLLANTLKQITEEPDLIIPMPLHKNRLKQRKFNQVELLLRYHQQATNWKIKNNVVNRIKDTSPQTLTTYKQRADNLQNAFNLKQEIFGLKILIVDDVITTGASINSLAKLLKDNGAKQVEACSLMRVV